MDLPVDRRLLAVGLPLTILAGAVLAAPLLAGLGIWELAATSAVLAPTDASLGIAVVTNPRVPTLIRHSLNVESGLNDGIVLPFLTIFLALAAESASADYTLDVFGTGPRVTNVDIFRPRLRIERLADGSLQINDVFYLGGEGPTPKPFVVKLRNGMATYADAAVIAGGPLALSDVAIDVTPDPASEDWRFASVAKMRITPAPSQRAYLMFSSASRGSSWNRKPCILVMRKRPFRT